MTVTTPDPTGRPIACRKCGAPVSGKFCSACGTPAEVAHGEGWSSVLTQVAKGDGSTLFATAMAILREPVAGPVRLALDPAYAGHIKFYLTFVSAAFVAVFVAPQELSRNFLGLDTAGDQSLVKRMMLLQALIVLVLTPLTYYLFKWRSAEPRTPLSYFKLSLIVIAASNLLVVAVLGLLLTGLVAAAVIFPNQVSSAPAALQPYYEAFLFIAAVVSLVYVVAINVRYWRIHWIWPTIVLTTAQISSELVSWPILNALGSGTLGSLFK